MYREIVIMYSQCLDHAVQRVFPQIVQGIPGAGGPPFGLNG